MRTSHPLIVNGQRMTYAKGVVAEGKFLFVSGVTAQGNTLSEQVDDCWNNLKQRVEDMGGRLENIVQRMTFVTDMAAWNAEGRARQAAWLEKNCPALLEDQPASTLIGCVALAQPSFQIEIQVIIVVD
jgi:enamine deaminase RidA (YjgF/YER057c/UK114 family)